jgi:hypothetical protein
MTEKKHGKWKCRPIDASIKELIRLERKKPSEAVRILNKRILNQSRKSGKLRPKVTPTELKELRAAVCTPNRKKVFRKIMDRHGVPYSSNIDMDTGEISG